MKKPPLEQIEKLPKWASEYIRHIERCAARAEDRMRELIDDSKDARIFVERIESTTAGVENQRYGIPGICATFKVRDGEHGDIDVAFTDFNNTALREKGKSIMIQGNGSIVFSPRASNCIEVWLDED